MSANIVTQEIQDSVSSLYIAFFGRAPDAAGFGYWTEEQAAGVSPFDIAANFARSEEWLSNYGGLQPSQQVDLFYNNVFGRDADAAGAKYWTDAINGGLPFSTVAYQIIWAAYLGGTGVDPDDNALVLNKIAVAEYFAMDLKSNDTAIAATAFVGVTQDEATVTAAEERLAGEVNPPVTYTLTTAIETVPATGVMAAGSLVNGAINGANTTFQTGDILNGNTMGTASNVNVTIAAASADALGPLVDMNNIGTATFRTLAAAQINAQLYTNVATIASAGSNNILTVNNGALASTYALSDSVGNATDGLAVGIRAGDTTGASTINFSLSNVGTAAAGTAAAVPSAISTTVTGLENIAIATTGTNNFTFTGNTGTATSSGTLTITGDGNNTVTIGAGGMATTSTITAADATGNLTLNVGTNLSSNDTIIGTAGTSDTLQATVNGVIATGLNVSGFETFRMDSGATAATLGFTTNPAFSTVRVDSANAAGALRTLANGGGFGTLNFVGDGTNTAAGTATAIFFSGLSTTGGWTGAADTLAVNVGNRGVTKTAATPAYTLGAAGGFLNLAGAETVNLAISDVTAGTERTSIGAIQGTTLQSVSVTSAGNVDFNLSAVDVDSATNSNSITSINLSGVTGVTGGATTMTIGSVNNIIAPALTITAGAAGLNATLGGAVVETAGDVLTFVGGNGNDTFASNAFVGNLVATGGAGADAFTAGAGAGTLATSQLTGGTGVDTFTINNGGTNVINDLGNGVDILVNTLGTTNATVSANWTATAASGNAAGAVTLNMAAGVTTVSTLAAAAGHVVGYTINANANTASTIVGSTVGDTAVGSTLADVISGSGGADLLTGGTGSDRFVQLNTDSVARSASTFAGANFAAGDTITFGTGLDRVTDFTAGAGGDVLQVSAGTGPVTAIGVATGTLVAGTNYFLSGNYVAATGVFTITANGLGADTLIVQGYAAAGTNITTNASAVLLQGVDSDNLVAGNFIV